MHSIGVVVVGLELAEQWDVEFEKVYIAGLLHDCGRYIPPEQLRHQLASFGEEIPAEDREFPQLWHCLYGAAVLRYQLRINDSELYNAIWWHSTGEARLTPLQKIIFLADSIEPTREFQGVAELRKLAYIDLDIAMAKAVEMKLCYLNSHGITVHPRLLRAYRFYVERRKD
ncbi:bis(5'-nucleosyl)-tetraphosphatase (symmetrical) YqeK [Candidatus Sumerlaeota bacterium]|nr:bis(5'-nucleosyl)-tetraphosphatase (symmetrical) YqeK [Candidatus Sumerlaeota bacterium]